VVKARTRSTGPLTVTLCAAGLGAVVMASVRTANDLQQRRIQQIGADMNRLTRKIEELQVKVAKLMAPERLEPKARKLGMMYPRNEQILRSGPAVEKSP
jgi:cell division protein FtsL